MREQIIRLRRAMTENGIDIYVIPTSDYHGSEYVGDYFKCREYVSGFTGSAGTLVVTLTDAELWTDGRYFLQAERELALSGISLKKTGQPGVPTMSAWIKRMLRPGMVLGYDGRCVMESEAKLYRQIAMGEKSRLCTDRDLVGMIWNDRPARSAAEPWILGTEYAGQSRKEKIEKVRQELAKKKADVLLLASLCDICWLLNVRGGDVECTPVVLSYLCLSQKDVVWYVQDCLPPAVRTELEADGIRIRDYDEICTDLSALPEGTSVYYDPEMTSDALVGAIPDKVECIEGINPTLILKALKNPTEVENERLAHIKDGICLTKFIYWLKSTVPGGNVSEISAGDYIGALRRSQEHFVGDSFSPIIAYGPHGAIVHYSATKDTDVLLKPEGFVLADTGGHYLEGTTDVTRTISLGKLTVEQKHAYTLVLKGHIDLAAAHFEKGCDGEALDTLARGPLKERNLDYNHGTGHGVGYLLSVHEGPNSFRCPSPADKRRKCVLEEGMITSNEPGLYLTGKFGVRIENLVLCRKDPEHSGHLSLETLTMAPYDREAIVAGMLTREEIAWLNDYHQKVYDLISPHLTKEERDWLFEETRPIG